MNQSWTKADQKQHWPNKAEPPLTQITSIYTLLAQMYTQSWTNTHHTTQPYGTQLNQNSTREHHATTHYTTMNHMWSNAEPYIIRPGQTEPKQNNRWAYLNQSWDINKLSTTNWTNSEPDKILPHRSESKLNHNWTKQQLTTRKAASKLNHKWNT